jgi:hypothetical protein
VSLILVDLRKRNENCDLRVSSIFSYVRCPSQQLDPQKTVFVGALHGMLNAEGLSNIFNDLFGGVVYASELIQNNAR